MYHRFTTDPTMVAYGEENRDWGGAFACYRGLTEALPTTASSISPISEAAIVGTAVGYALEGGRVVAELMYCDFLGRAGDEVFNQMAKWQSMSAGVLKCPSSSAFPSVTNTVPSTAKTGPPCAPTSPASRWPSRHALRCQGHAQRRPVGHRPRGLLRKSAPLRHGRTLRRRSAPITTKYPLASQPSAATAKTSPLSPLVPSFTAH